MSITVAAVQASYCGPHQETIFDSSSSGTAISHSRSSEANIYCHPRNRAEISLSNHRWSQHPPRGDCIAEEKQMSNHDAAPNHPRREGFPTLPPPTVPPRGSSYGASSTAAAGEVPKMEGQQSPRYELLPPRRRSPDRAQGFERRPSRSLGVHSILNPPYADDEERNPKRSINQSDEDHKDAFTSGSIASSSRPPSSSSVGTDEITTTGTSGPRVVRRILTPISPRLHRMPSFGRIATGTIDAHEQPFLSPSARIHTQEPGVGGIPPLPAIHPRVAQQSPFTRSAQPTPPLGPMLDHRHASGSGMRSSRASPSTSPYPSYGQSVHPSPLPPSQHTSVSAPTPPRSYHLAPTSPVGPLGNVSPGLLEGEQQNFGIPVVSSGQNYQILTIDTTRGQTQLAVEVQAASKQADEKRKRNAGASARFRARRKEKEREASSKISNLEQDLAFAKEDSEYYKRERDFLQDLFIRTVPHYETYLRARPSSPRIGRVRHVSEPLSSMGEDSPAPASSVPLSRERYEQFERFERLERLERDHREGEPPSQRRRTDTFPLVSPGIATGPRTFSSSAFPPFPLPPATPGRQAYSQSHPHPDSPHRSADAPAPAFTPPPPNSGQYRAEQPYGSWPPPTAPPR